MITCRLPICASAIMLSPLVTQTSNAQVSGIYVERYFPTNVNPCTTGSPPDNDGWFAVPGSRNRVAWCPGTTQQPGFDYGSNVAFTAISGATYRVFAVDPSQPIGNITVSGSGYTLLVGRADPNEPPFINEFQPLDTAGGGAIGTVSAPGGTVQIRSTDTVNSISAGTVVRVDARTSIGPVTSFGAITGAIRAPRLTGSVTAATGIRDVLIEQVDGGSVPVDFTGTVSTTGGSITLLRVRNTRFLGQALAPSGSIERVDVDGPGSGIGPVSGTPATIRARNGINQISAPSILADVEANAFGGDQLGVESGLGNLRIVEATAGPLVGSIRCNNIFQVGPTFSYIRAAGDLDADITVRNVVGNHGGPNLASFRAGGSFKAGRTIRVGRATFGPGSIGNGGFRINAAGGLQGQIIIGAINTQEFTCAGGALGFWGGAAVVGPSSNPITLDPRGCAPGITYSPYYEPTSASLGGGAIGTVPFRIHESDCIPERDTVDCVDSMFVDRVWPGETTPRRTAIIRHYGPITDESPSDSLPPVVITRQDRFIPPGGTLPPVVDVTNQFDTRIAGSTAGTPEARELWIAPKSTAMWDPFILTEYTINLRKANQSAPGELQSETYTINKPAVLGYPTTFSVGPCALFSYLNAGQTGPDLGESSSSSASTTNTEPYDLALVLAAWLANPADVTNDGLIDADDADALRQAVEILNARAAARAMPAS